MPTRQSEAMSEDQTRAMMDPALESLDATRIRNNDVRELVARFQGVGYYVAAKCEDGDQRRLALAKLIEAKDAAVRAFVKPGG